ncbi:hypothetical protein AAFF_G00307040 [Aldrovandia affinis]|uniref:Uncharacterized protein n=1 Tax=Aldrovandia affinis TaxID=143900 RepID=A0AAD7R8T0_9TELE|nr:hypothetical protein AAFF_G00307040 [Aldrovandia affinis]
MVPRLRPTLRLKAACSEMKAEPRPLWLTLLFLVQGITSAQAGESFPESEFRNLRQESSAFSGPLGLGLVATAGLVLALMLCVIRKMRRTEGRYQPRKEEQTGARSVETPDVLKLPKEERLI